MELKKKRERDNIDVIPETLAVSTIGGPEKAWEIMQIDSFPSILPSSPSLSFLKALILWSSPKMRIPVMGSLEVWSTILPVNTVKYRTLHIADSQKMLINCFREPGRTLDLILE